MYYYYLYRHKIISKIYKSYPVLNKDADPFTKTMQIQCKYKDKDKDKDADPFTGVGTTEMWHSTPQSETCVELQVPIEALGWALQKYGTPPHSPTPV